MAFIKHISNLDYVSYLFVKAVSSLINKIGPVVCGSLR